MAQILCTTCGEMFNDEYIDFLENGNPACPRCVEEEEKRKNNEEK